MKQNHLILFFIYLGISSALFGQSKLETKINFEVENMPISQAILKLGEVSNFDIAFSNNYFKNTENISLRIKNQSIEYVLNQILIGTSIKYKFRNNQIILQKKSPEKKTISGYISDAHTGERLISATVFCPNLGLGTLSNEYGFYSLTLPRGQHQIQWSYIGFSEKAIKISIENNQRLDIDLEPAIILAEVIVRPDSTGISASFPSSAGDKILNNQIKIIPDIGGEADLIRVLQMLPGIASGADGFGGLSVRGGSSDQNLVLLDEVPLYNATHLMGQFSIFNANAVRSVKMLKGGFPARYGGRAASILDVRTREGNRRNWTAEGGVGMLAANANIEGPFAQKRGSIFLAGRKTHSHFLLNPLIEKTFFDEETDEIGYDFYDLNGKLNFDLGKNDRLLISFYQGGDDFSGKTERDSLNVEIERNAQLNWKNRILSLRWNHIFTDKIFSNTTFTTSRFDSQYRFFVFADVEEEEEEEMPDQLFFQDFSSDIKDWTFKSDWDFLPNAQHHLKFGLGYTKHSIVPIFESFDESEFEDPDGVDFENYELDDPEVIDAHYFYSFLENDWDLNNRLRLNAGLRFSVFHSQSNTYSNFEPRLAFQYSLSKNAKINGSITRMVQYIHLLVNEELRVFSNIWLPANQNLAPQSAWQGTTGMEFLKPTFSYGFEAYYKKVDNIYKDVFITQLGETPIASTNLNYGIEFYLRKNFGNWGGWANYTLSKSEIETPIFEQNEIVRYEKSPFQFDARHQFKLFLYKKINKNWTASFSWVYTSPLPSTIFFNSADLSFDSNPPPPVISNNRTSANHRLDLGLSYFLKIKQSEHNLKFSLYNSYNRANAAFHVVDFEINPATNQLEPTEPRPVSLMPILPSLYYGVKF